MTVFSESGFSVAVVGATGQVGTVMRDILVDRAFPIRELRLFATARSAGSTIEVDGREIVVEDVATADPSGIKSPCSRRVQPDRAPTPRASRSLPTSAIRSRACCALNSCFCAKYSTS